MIKGEDMKKSRKSSAVGVARRKSTTRVSTGKSRRGTRKTSGNGKSCPTGMRVDRFFTKEGQDVLGDVKYARRSCKITNPDGTAVFSMDGAEIPADWSQLATDIMVSKYFRKAQAPQFADGADPAARRTAQGR